MKVLVINGPNLDLLGERQPDLYGKLTLKEINEKMVQLAKELKCEIEFFQSNHEGKIVDTIGEARGKFDFLIINPAAYTHTSVAIRDAIVGAGVPTIEVHLSNIYAREEFRRKSLIAPVAIGQICGFGPDGYLLALRAAVNRMKG